VNGPGAGVDPVLCASARAYVTFRAVGIPFYLITNFAEGCYIGFKEDSFTPLLMYCKGAAVTFALLIAMGATGG